MICIRCHQTFDSCKGGHIEASAGAMPKHYLKGAICVECWYDLLDWFREKLQPKQKKETETE